VNQERRRRKKAERHPEARRYAQTIHHDE